MLDIPDVQGRFSFQVFSANPPNLHGRSPAALKLSPAPYTAFTITCSQAPSLSFPWLLEAGGANFSAKHSVPHQDSAICLGLAPTHSILSPPSATLTPSLWNGHLSFPDRAFGALHAPGLCTCHPRPLQCLPSFLSGNILVCL